MTSPIIQTPAGLFERSEILARLDLLIDVFNAKNNDRGLNIVLEAFDEVRYKVDMNDRKWNWLLNNIRRHSLPPLEPWDATKPQAPAIQKVEVEAVLEEIYGLLATVVDKLESLKQHKG